MDRRVVRAVEIGEGGNTPPTRLLYGGAPRGPRDGSHSEYLLIARDLFWSQVRGWRRQLQLVERAFLCERL
jgi:hypothetical protein